MSIEGIELRFLLPESTERITAPLLQYRVRSMDPLYMDEYESNWYTVPLVYDTKQWSKAIQKPKRRTKA